MIVLHGKTMAEISLEQTTKASEIFKRISEREIDKIFEGTPMEAKK